MNSFFSTWKIYIAILFGLSATFFIAYSSISTSKFVDATNHTGSYCWKDVNNNSKIDYSNPEEFYVCKDGTFDRQSALEMLSSVELQENGFWFIFFAFCATFCRDLGYVLRLRLLTIKAFSWKQCFNVIFLWEFASSLTPGSVGGSGVAMFIMKRQGLPLGRSTAIVVVTAILDNIFFLLLSIFLFLLVSPSELFPSSSLFERGISFIYWFGFSILMLVTLVLLLSLFVWPNLIKKVVEFVFRSKLLSRWRTSSLSFVNGLVTTSHEFRSAKFSFWIFSFLATCVSWISRYLVINFLAEAFLNLSAKDHLLVLGKQLVLWIVMLVSPTPGSSGVAEFAFRAFFESFSESTLLLVIMAIVWRLISYFPYLVIGSILFPRWIKSTSKRNV